MPVTQTTKRWVASGNTGEASGEPTFLDFSHFLRMEQRHWVPAPGNFIEQPVPGTSEEWAAISAHLQVEPQPERKAELMRLLFEAHEKMEDWTEARLRRQWGPDVVTGWPTQQEWDFDYLHPKVAVNVPFNLWAITQPTATDKVMSLTEAMKHNSMPRASQPGLPVVAHVAQFDDLQAFGGNEEQTGYKIVHDLLQDEILISKIKFHVPENGEEGAKQRQPAPLEDNRVHALPGGNTASHVPPSLIFRGSPATLAVHILSNQPLSPSLDPGFDLLLRLLAAEWIIANAFAIKWVEHPSEHMGTSTEDLKAGLVACLKEDALKMLGRMRFPNQWGREMRDLNAFQPEWNRRARERMAEREGRFG